MKKTVWPPADEMWFSSACAEGVGLSASLPGGKREQLAVLLKNDDVPCHFL